MAYDSNYIRVIPRDLFNEASLLKCVGQLYLILETGTHTAKIDQERLPYFKIAQIPSSGALTIANLTISVGEHTYMVLRPLNSRRPWPLYVFSHEFPDSEDVPVFNDDGGMHPDFRALIMKRR